MVQLKVNVEITRQMLEDIFVTAIEGGSNYWCGIRNIKKIKSIVNEQEPFAIVLFKYIVDKQGTAEIVDVLDPSSVIGELSYNTLQERLQKLADSPLKNHLMNEINEDGDAESSDVVFQFLCLGEYIYS